MYLEGCESAARSTGSEAVLDIRKSPPMAAEAALAIEKDPSTTAEATAIRENGIMDKYSPKRVDGFRPE